LRVGNLENLKPVYTFKLFELAAGMYLCDPQPELLSFLKEQMGREIENDSSSLGAAAFQFHTQEPLWELEVVRQDYYDLFFVPVSGRYLPPYESARLEGRLGGARTRQVNWFYQESGFKSSCLKSSPAWGMNLAPDHIGLEMGFAAILMEKIERGSPLERTQAGAAFESFMDQHLSLWAGSYGCDLAKKAFSEPYRFLGWLTASLAKIDAKWPLTDAHC
jgi:putative dimethyl sulfoxide reductase chaperone